MFVLFCGCDDILCVFRERYRKNRWQGKLWGMHAGKESVGRGDRCERLGWEKGKVVGEGEGKNEPGSGEGGGREGSGKEGVCMCVRVGTKRKEGEKGLKGRKGKGKGVGMEESERLKGRRS